MEKSLNDYISDYKVQLEKGSIQKAYKGLIEYIMSLRNHFINQYSNDFVAGNLYQGYMDITFFTFTPISLKNQKLKILIVFNHEKTQFEVWLSAQNKKIREKYWNIFKGSDWNKYNMPSTADEGFSIIDNILISNPDFDNPDSLTELIETKALSFIKDISDALN